MLDTLLEPIARIFLALPFIHSGISVILDKKPTVGLMQSRNLPFIPVLLPIALLLKLGASLALVFNIFPALAAGSLAAFTIVATIIFHNFWSFEGQEREVEIYWFTTNTGLIGGLILLMAVSLP